ncbi:MAG: 2-succinyl-5-enolpyruvyl-6-hydroxy-3-cyclohexene-1-carboxylic-acid synthase [Prevotella sp.]|nr:2-succinyl-5-enolpyruvyl-6-hydroxy-3-cyclohexene-1-carboxylic-acid synthase [Prevotella sp.]
MYSDKENLNILTALLVKHGIRHAVVCPGSRNAPIAHNLHEAGIRCVPVTDERSAGFQALGMAQATGLPVVVCVTSGTALLNLAPAVAEAFYQQQPLMVVSADRPLRWIDQLDGQTLPQENALKPFVRKAVALPGIITCDEERWHCNRLVNEALVEVGGRMASLKSEVAGPVHINVPLEEPLFEFNTGSLPEQRVVMKIDKGVGKANYRFLAQLLSRAERPMVVVGQHEPMDEAKTLGAALLRTKSVILAERLAGCHDFAVPVDEALLLVKDDEAYQPDTIFYFGGTLVSKRLKHFLRKAGAKGTVVQVAPDGQLRDVTMHLDYLCVGTLQGFIAYLGQEASVSSESTAFHQRWEKVFAQVRQTTDDEQPPFSQLAVVKYFEQQLDDMEYPFHLHYANSTPVRLANSLVGQHVWCNRGVNGIEGSLSTAVGFSIATDDRVFCVIGDLSFFYDQNALWNQNLRGNLRIILLNNGGGGIFHTLPGLEKSPVRDTLVTAGHHTSAQGICTQNDVGYLKADNMVDMKRGIVALLTENRQRPMLLEVFTNPETDAKALANHYKLLNDSP